METTPGKYLIYGLVDPRTEAIRYIGKSCNGMYRPDDHGRDKKLAVDHTYKGNWIRQLKAAGLMYSIVILEDVSHAPDTLADAEIKWIAYGRQQGWPLTNHTNGGEGMLGHTLPAAARAKIGEANSRRVIRPETREKQRQYRLAHPVAKSGNENAARVNRDKMARGEEHWLAKLTEAQVAEIRSRKAAGETQVALAKEFGISPTSMSRIVNNVSWTDPATKDAAIAAIKPKIRLTEDQVRDIRRRHKRGERIIDIATEYGMNRLQIGRIVNRQAWAELPDEVPPTTAPDA